MTPQDGWKQEADDLDAVLRLIGLDPQACRTEGGSLNIGRVRAAVEASARQLSEQPGHLLIAAERWAQLEHMWSRNATPETIASYIGRPEILDRISKIRREHEAAVQGNAA